MSYKSTHTGAQIDAGVSAALNPDATPTLSSTNLVTSGGVAIKLSEKQDTLVFDNTPTNGSNNPVKSGGIYAADAALEQMILASFPTDSISNVPVASFADGADGIPVKALTVNIDYLAAGRTSANLVAIGANLCDEDFEQGSINNSTGEPNQPTSNNIRTKNYMPIKGGLQYAAVKAADVSFNIYYYDKDKTYISYQPSSVNVFSAPANAAFFKVRTADNYGTTFNKDFGVNYPATETSYQAYRGGAIGVTFPATIYGGVLDVVNSKLTSTLDAAGDPLDTPVVYDVSVSSVATPLGNNNTFADCGDVAALTYRADVGLYIDKKLAEA